MNTLHENLVLSLWEARNFAERCIAEVGSDEDAVGYNDIFLALGSLINHGVQLGGEA